MATTVLDQAYIEKLIRSIQERSEMDFDQLCKLLFAVIDIFCASKNPSYLGFKLGTSTPKILIFHRIFEIYRP